MNETEIHDTPSAGQIIAAYGESTSRRWSSKALAIIAGVVVCLGILLTLGGIFITKKLPVPRNTLLLAYIRSGTPLPEWAPELWKDAARRASPFPVLFGLHLNQEKKIEPFAITLGTFAPDNKTPAHLPWQLISSVTEESPTSLLSLSPSWTDYFRPAWLRVWLPVGENIHIGGPLIDRTWKTNMIVRGSSVVPAVMGPNFLDLERLPALWPVWQTFLRDKGLSIASSSPPAYLSFTNSPTGDISVELEFADTLSTTTKTELAGGFGLTETKPYRLPDGTVVRERRLPITLFDHTTATSWDLEGEKKLILDKNIAIFGQPELFSVSTVLPSSCHGSVLAILDNQTILALADTLTFSAPPGMQRLVAMEDGGHVYWCW